MPQRLTERATEEENTPAMNKRGQTQRAEVAKPRLSNRPQHVQAQKRGPEDSTDSPRGVRSTVSPIPQRSAGTSVIVLKSGTTSGENPGNGWVVDPIKSATSRSFYRAAFTG